MWKTYSHTGSEEDIYKEALEIQREAMNKN